MDRYTYGLIHSEYRDSTKQEIDKAIKELQRNKKRMIQEKNKLKWNNDYDRDIYRDSIENLRELISALKEYKGYYI